MNYCGLILSDVSNGIGVRTSLFVSGCRNHCKGCFNPETWDFNYGSKFTEEVKEKIFQQMDDYHKGITILGGDPLEPENAEEILPFLKEFKSRFPDKDIWLYSGYLYETIDKNILQYIDVLVDGKFEIDNKSVSLPFRGSTNQRVINVQKSLSEGKIVLLMK